MDADDGDCWEPSHQVQGPSREPSQVQKQEGAKRRPQMNHQQRRAKVHPGAKAGDTDTSNPDRAKCPWGWAYTELLGHGQRLRVEVPGEVAQGD